MALLLRAAWDRQPGMAVVNLNDVEGAADKATLILGIIFQQWILYNYMYTSYTCMYISVFDKLIWHTVDPNSFLFGTAQFSLWTSGAVNYDYSSLTALTLC